MLKPTTLDISQTNLAAFGTDLEYKIKQASADTEPAFKAINKSHPGVYIFRVNKFKLEETTIDDDVANFFAGDSYVIASVTPTADVRFTVFYWVGATTTQDEAGVAAYKAFELDNFFGGAAVQYRETCYNESAEFRALFPAMRILNGGYDSGFRHNTEAEFRPRLFRVHTDHLEEVTTCNRDHAYLYLYKEAGAKETPASLRDGTYEYINILQWCPTVGQKHATMRAARYLDEAHDDGATITVIDTWDCFLAHVKTEETQSQPRVCDRAISIVTTMIVEYTNTITVSGTQAVSTTSRRVISELGNTLDLTDTCYVVIKNNECTVYGKLPFAGLCANDCLRSRTGITKCKFVH